MSVEELRKLCPVKWHSQIPADGISLGVADVDFKGPAGAVQYLKDHLREDFSFYQEQAGLDGAIDAAVEYLQHKSIPTSRKNIQIIEGTMMGIYVSMKWISNFPGDLLVLGPIYEPIHRHATTTGNNLHWTPITKNGLDRDHIKQIMEEHQIKMITMCNPTNPIGYVFDTDELQFIADIAEEYDCYVFADELYEPLWFDKPQKSIASIEGMAERSILLYGFSKAYGLAGYRAGFMYIGPDIDQVKFITSQQIVSPSPVSSLITEFALTDKRAQQWVQDFREHTRKTTRFAADKFNKLGYSCEVPQGCFFVYPDLGIDDQKFSQQLLEEEGIQVVPGSAFGPMGQRHVRINCATSIARLDEAITRIHNLIQKNTNE